MVAWVSFRLGVRMHGVRNRLSQIGVAIWAGFACTALAVAQSPMRVVVVTTNTTPPAFLQELRADDPKTIQRVAEREGFEAFQKEDAWYLIPRTLLSQSQIARTNRILSHLLERLSDEDAPTSFTLDSLPSAIAEEMRQVLENLATRLESDGQFSLHVTLQLRGRLKDGTSFYVPSVASVSESRVSWYTGSWGGDIGLGSQGTTSMPTDAFLRQFGIRDQGLRSYAARSHPTDASFAAGAAHARRACAHRNRVRRGVAVRGTGTAC